MISLRHYQTELIDKVRAAMAEHDSVVMVLPTGAGKTLTTAWIIARMAERGKRCIFSVHRNELLYQTSKAFQKLNIAHGFIAAGEDYDEKHLCHIASIDTLRRRLDIVKAPDMLVIDEAHRAPAESWKKVIQHYTGAKKLLITATPERLDGKGLKHIATDMVQGVTTAWLIEAGHLAPFKIYAASIKPDLAGVKTTGGDYNSGQLAAAMDSGTLTGDAIEHYRKYADGKQGIIFAVTIEHSKNVVSQFNKAEIPAAHIDGETPKIAREDIVERFRYGEYRILSNVNLFTEGFDVPSAEVCIMLRPTKSLALYLQMAGRVLRPVEGKTAIILDHAGNVHQHGMPDIDRQWSLEGKAGRAITKPPALATCEHCYFMWQPRPGHPKVCPACAHVHEKDKREIKAEGGELAEITRANNPWAWAATKSLRNVMPMVKTRSDLMQIAAARGYKHGWVWYKAKELGL